MPIKDKKIKAELWKVMGKRFSPNPVQCQFCNFKDNLTLDHIVSTASGGTDDPDNIQVLCTLCHTMKNQIREMRLRELVYSTRGKENNSRKTDEYHKLRHSMM